MHTDGDDFVIITPAHSAPSSAIRHSRNPSVVGGGEMGVLGGLLKGAAERATSSQWSVPLTNDSILTAGTTITSGSFALTHQGSSWWPSSQQSIVFGQQGGSVSPTHHHATPAEPLSNVSPSLRCQSAEVTPPRGTVDTNRAGQTSSCALSKDLLLLPPPSGADENAISGSPSWLDSGETTIFAATATATFVDSQCAIRSVDTSPTPVPSFTPAATPTPHTTMDGPATRMQPSIVVDAVPHQARHLDHYQRRGTRDRAATMLTTTSRHSRPPSPPPLQASHTMPSFPIVNRSAVSTQAYLPPSLTINSKRPVAVGPLTFGDSLRGEFDALCALVDEHASFVLQNTLHRAQRCVRVLEPLSRVQDASVSSTRTSTPCAFPAMDPAVPSMSPVADCRPAPLSASFAGQLHLSVSDLLRSASTPHVALSPPLPRALVPSGPCAAIGGFLNSSEAVVLRRAAGMLLIDVAWWLFYETLGREDKPNVAPQSPPGGTTTSAQHHVPRDDTDVELVKLCMVPPSWSGEAGRLITSLSSTIESVGRHLLNHMDMRTASSFGGDEPKPLTRLEIVEETARACEMSREVVFALAAQLPTFLSALRRLFYARRSSHVARVLMERSLLCIDEQRSLERKRTRMYDDLEAGTGLVGDTTDHLRVLDELRDNNFQVMADICSALRDVTVVPVMLPNVWACAPRMLESSLGLPMLPGSSGPTTSGMSVASLPQKLRHVASTWHTLCGARLHRTDATQYLSPVSVAHPHVLFVAAFPEQQQVPASVMSLLLQVLADAAGLPPPRHFICESHSYCGLWVPDMLALQWGTLVRKGGASLFANGYAVPSLLLPYVCIIDSLRLVLYLPSLSGSSAPHHQQQGGMTLPGACVQPASVSSYWQMHLSSRGGTANLTLVANAIGRMVGTLPVYLEHVGPSRALNVWVPLSGRESWMDFGETQLMFVDVASGELLALDSSPASLLPPAGVPSVGGMLPGYQNPVHGGGTPLAAAGGGSGGFEVLTLARKRNRTRCGKESKKGRPKEARSATAV